MEELKKSIIEKIELCLSEINRKSATGNDSVNVCVVKTLCEALQIVENIEKKVEEN